MVNGDAIPTKVWRGKHRDPDDLFGPLPAVRLGDTLAYEFELPDHFTPWPNHTRLQRVFVLLDAQVQMDRPCWSSTPNGPGLPSPESWYVDLVTVERLPDGYVVRDLYIDLVVPRPGEPHRTLDLDEFADAMDAGTLSQSQASDALRRWQRFLNEHVQPLTHLGDAPDFPPEAVADLARLPAPLGPVVRAPR